MEYTPNYELEITKLKQYTVTEYVFYAKFPYILLANWGKKLETVLRRLCIVFSYQAEAEERIYYVEWVGYRLYCEWVNEEVIIGGYYYDLVFVFDKYWDNKCSVVRKSY